MTRQIKVDIVGNSKPLTNALDQAIGKVTGFGDKMRSLGGGNLGKGLAVGAGIAGFNLLTSAVDVAVSKMDEMHQAFLDDQASQARLQNAIKNTVKNYDEATKSMEDFAQAMQAVGFEDDATRDSLFQLVGITHDATKAIELSRVAMDLARAKNIDLAAATDVVARAYTGVARGLTLVGIDARGASSGLELVQRIIDNTKGAVDAYAKTSPGRIATANAKMQDTFEKVGGAIDKVSQVVIPVMAAGLGTLVDIAGNLIGVWTRMAEVIQENLGPQLEFAAQLVRNLLTPFAILNDVVNNVTGALGGIGGGQQQNTNPNGTPLPTGVTVRKYGPIMHDGGIVPGPVGSNQVITAQAGELVTPRGQVGSQVININIASFIGSDRDIDRFADRLAFRLRATSLS